MNDTWSIRRWTTQGIICRSDSLWASPLLWFPSQMDPEALTAISAVRTMLSGQIIILFQTFVISDSIRKVAPFFSTYSVEGL